MSISNCQYDLDTKFVEPCSNCRITRFQRKIPFTIGNFILYITYLYEIRNCFQGFTNGDLLYAMSLLPREEQEVEIVQRTRYERNLHEQQSVEMEFETEFMNTLRIQASAKHDVNVSASADGGFNFLDIVKGGASTSGSSSAHFESSVFNETMVRAASKVSRHYDVAVDIKTEMENQYRSLRRIVNPSECRVVTYFFKQLNKKYNLEVALVDVRFDLIQKVSNWHTELLPYYAMDSRRAVATLRPAVIASASHSDTDIEASSLQRGTLRLASTQSTPLLQYAAVNQYRNLVYREVGLAKELSADEFLAKVKTLQIEKGQLEKILSQFTALRDAKENKAGYVLYRTEYCLRTNSVMAEPKVSHCSICECNHCECEGTMEQKDMELNKLKAEIELLRKQIERLG